MSTAMKNSARGFTLVEMMIVVVVVAILASFAIPSYREYVRRADRADAKTALLQNAQFLERNRTMSNRYDLDGAGNAIDDAALPVTQSPMNADAKYTITVVPTQTTYVLSAVPVAGGPMDGDGCGTFTLNQTGAKDLDNETYTVERCWNK
jgi:type IV pilus assembly protein PilE